MNIVNYYLLNNVFQVMRLRERENQLIQQIEFQTNKYEQISSAYRNTRSLLHDTKKHYLYIQNCVSQKEYSKVNDYLSEALQHLEHSYSRIHTGNLVIDAFVSSYMEMAKQENIDFITNIQVVAEQIPTDDYDLCVILGNLLDNSINACRLIPPSEKKTIEIELLTLAQEFVIHVTNTQYQNPLKKAPCSTSEELYHGYGVTNIRKLTEKYDGSYSCFSEKQSFETIIVIPIKVSRRF